jgi:peptide/nickel transport system ATP-binding protein
MATLRRTPAAPRADPDGTVLAVEDLHVTYTNRSGATPALRGVSLQIAEGEAFGLVGESGCGKSTLAFAVMRYLGRGGRVTGGRILYQGQDLLTLSDGALRGIRGRRITMVYQDPQSSLNPSIVVGEQLAEVFRLQLRQDRETAWASAERILGQVKVADAAAVMRRYPHQLSGGMQQRVVIAMALATDPDLLIMDEPTTGLDVTVEAAVLDLVADLRQEFRSAIFLISHNLGVIARVCDRVGVMYAGEIVEQGTAEEIFLAPRHPYTVGLLGSLPRLGQHRRAGGSGEDVTVVQVRPIPGRMPSPRAMPPGCAFAPRCFMARPACDATHPPLERIGSTQLSRCLFWQEVRQPEDDVQVRRSFDTIPEASINAANPDAPLLQVVDLRKEFRQAGSLSLLGDGNRTVKAVDGVSLDLPRGTTLGIVGESGCGKSTLARCVAGLVEPTSGTIDFEGEPLPAKVEERPRSIRRRLQMVFQNPDVTLNPSHTVGHTLARSIRLLGSQRGAAARDRARDLLRAVNLDERYLERLPHQLSGGERQRVAIARALAGEPHLVICDEPLSALDVSVQAVILNLLSDLQDREGISYLLISHDLSVVQYLADQVAVTYLGKVVDLGPASAMATPPYHPYTEALLRAVPVPDPRRRAARTGLQGSPPSAIDVHRGCPFHTRCPRKLGPICEEQTPPWYTTATGRRYACHIQPADLEQLQRTDAPLAASEGLDVGAG